MTDTPPDAETGGTETADDVAWTAMMAKPASRGELLQALELMAIVHLSQATFGVALIDSDEATQRYFGEQAVDRVLNITKLSKDFVERWTQES